MALNLHESEIKTEKFEIFITGLLSTIGQHVDTNKYEDFARQILGNKAYLLFSFDKLILSASKQLLSIANDETTQKSVNLYHRFVKHVESSKQSAASQHWHHETVYLSNFA